MIEETKINRGGAGLTFGSRGRGVTAFETKKGPSFSRLAESLGVMAKAGFGAAQERGNLAAKEAYDKAKLSTAKLTPKQASDEMLKARAAVQSGEGRGFFDKLLTNEDNAVKVWDKMESNSLSSKKFAAAHTFREQNPNLNEQEMKQGITQILSEGLTEAAAISDTVANGYADKTTQYLDKLELSIADEFVKKQKVINRDKVTKDTSRQRDEAMTYVLDLTAEDHLEARTSPKVYNHIQDRLKEPEAIQAVVDNLEPIFNEEVSNLVGIGATTKQQAYANRLTSVYNAADNLSSVEVFDEYVKRPQKGSGLSLLKADPDGVQKMRAQLVQQVGSRKQAMATTYRKSQSSRETGTIDNINATLGSLNQKAMDSGDPKDISNYSNAMNAYRQQLEADWLNKDSSGMTASLYNETSKALTKLEWSDAGRSNITKPHLNNKLVGMLNQYDLFEDPVSLDETWINQNKNWLDPRSLARASDILLKSAAKDDHNSRLQREFAHKAKIERRDLQTTTAYQGLHSSFTSQELALMKPKNDKLRASKGVAMPNFLQEEAFRLQAQEYAMTAAKDYKNKYKEHQTMEDYFKNYYSALDQLTNEQAKAIADWRSKNPKPEASAAQGSEIGDIKDIEDAGTQEKALKDLVATLPTDLADKDNYSDADTQKVKEMEPIMSSLLQKNMANFKSGKEAAAYLEGLAPGNKSMNKRILNDLWLPAMDARNRKNKINTEIERLRGMKNVLGVEMQITDLERLRDGSILTNPADYGRFE